MTKPKTVDFDAIQRRYDEEMNADNYGNITQERLHDILQNMGATDEAFEEIGMENYWD